MLQGEARNSNDASALLSKKGHCYREGVVGATRDRLKPWALGPSSRPGEVFPISPCAGLGQAEHREDFPISRRAGLGQARTHTASFQAGAGQKRLVPVFPFLGSTPEFSTVRAVLPPQNRVRRAGCAHGPGRLPALSQAAAVMATKHFKFEMFDAPGLRLWDGRPAALSPACAVGAGAGGTGPATPLVGPVSDLSGPAAVRPGARFPGAARCAGGKRRQADGRRPGETGRNSQIGDLLEAFGHGTAPPNFFGGAICFKAAIRPLFS
jgi:hypothetical protein